MSALISNGVFVCACVGEFTCVCVCMCVSIFWWVTRVIG
jgi:hypothetical protein